MNKLHSGHCGILIIMSFLIFSGCAKVSREQIDVPPEKLKEPVYEVSVQPFSGRYGQRMMDEIKGKLLSEGYIKVSSKSSAAVTGSIEISQIGKRDTQVSNEVEKKDDKGNKYKVTETTYYHVKKATANVNYAVVKNKKSIGGGTHEWDYEQTFPGSTREEARANSALDESIIQAIISQLAKIVVKDISPHKEVWEFHLQTGGFLGLGGNEHLKLGAEYYDKGLYEQAEQYWLQVTTNEPDLKEKAAAYYNLGVLRMHQSKLKEAYEMFRLADTNEPGNSTYIAAMAKSQKAAQNQIDIIDWQEGGAPVKGKKPKKQKKNKKNQNKASQN